MFNVFFICAILECSQGCRTCDNSGCLVCKKGRSLYRDDIWNFTMCRKTCPNGFRSKAVQGKGNHCQKGTKFLTSNIFHDNSNRQGKKIIEIHLYVLVRRLRTRLRTFSV